MHVPSMQNVCFSPGIGKDEDKDLVPNPIFALTHYTVRWILLLGQIFFLLYLEEKTPTPL